MTAPSAKPLFRAMKAKPDRGAPLPIDLPEQRRPGGDRQASLI